MELFDTNFELSSEIKDLNTAEIETTAFILSDGGKKRGYINLLSTLLKFKPKEDYIFFVNNYPTIEDINKLYKKLYKKNINSIIAIGGGSVIDSAKAVSAFLNLEYVTNIEDIINSPELLSNNLNIKNTKLTVIPTTAGTGAEATQFATIWDTVNKKKHSLDHYSLLPQNIFFIPKLLHTSNYETLLFPSLDTLSHSLESIWNKNSTKESNSYSIKSLEASFLNDLQQFKNLKNNVEYSIQISMSSYFAGKAINITRTSIAHSISYPLTLNYDVPHGLACSFTLPAIFEIVQDQLNLEKKDIKLIKKNIKNLESLDLKKRINRYLDLDKASELITQMQTKNRLKNFLKNINQESIQEILNKSF